MVPFLCLPVLEERMLSGSSAGRESGFSVTSFSRHNLATEQQQQFQVGLDTLIIYFLFSFILLWVSLVTQMVKNPPAMQETWVQSLGCPCIGKIPWRRERLSTPIKPQDWKRSVFIPIPKKAMPKNAQTTAQLHSSHTLVK